MLNVILTNKPNKRDLLDRFIRSRGISNFIIITEAADIGSILSDIMITSDSTFNLHIFDYYGDLSIVNTIRDYRDQINLLRVYVASIEDSHAYLTLTEDVFIMPNVFDILMYFWDSDACRAKNVAAFDLMHIDFFKVNIPDSLGRTDQLAININTQQIPLKYKTASGSVVETQGPQLVVSCKAKSKEIKSIFDTRNQEEVYSHRVRDLSDLPTDIVEDPVPKKEQEIVISKEPKPVKVKEPKLVRVKEPKSIKEKPIKQVQPEKGSSDKHDNGFSAFFKKFKFKEDEPVTEPLAVGEEPVATLEPEPIQEQIPIPEEQKSTESIPTPQPEESKSKPELKPFVTFSGVKGGTEVATGRAPTRRYTLSEVYASISQYCIEKKYISAEDGVSLQKEVANKPSRDALFGNLALERGLITEEQLIDAVTQVNHVEILTWEKISAMELDFTYFSSDKCKEFKFFKLKDAQPNDTAQIVCAFSLSSIHPEVRRLFDNPRILYTLDSYITRKLGETS